MKKVFQFIINEIVKNQLKRKGKSLKKNQIAKEIVDAKVEFKHIIQDSFLMGLGALSASFGLKGFLIPNSFIDGGVTGISLIISELTGISLSVFLILINLPFIILGFSTISKQFAFKSIGAIIILALMVHFIVYPVVTHDKLLVAVFGGFFLGLGIGLAIRGGAVIDGTEVLAVYISKKTSLTIGDIILLFNIPIFMVGAYVFSIEIALYAMLTYLSAPDFINRTPKII